MDVSIPFTRHALSNGLTVLVHEDHALPLVSVNLWYHVGSGHEPQGRTGFAHLFEHLMFEGSGHVPEGEFDRRLESVGGVNNGSTSPDRTNYWADVPASALELVLWLEADRMGFLLDAMTQEKLDLQRDVVKNERRQSYENRPYGLAWETVQGNLHPPGHPYHHSVIGSMEDLEAASLGDVHAFFREWYTPANASLAIAGDVVAEDVVALVERWFGDLSGGPRPSWTGVPAGALSEDRRIVLEDRVQLPRLYLAWSSARHYSDGDAALGVLGHALGEGRSSRLHRRLVHDEQVAQDVTAFQSGGERGGSFSVVVTAKPGVSLERLERVVDEELGDLASAGAREEEIERALAQIEAEFVHALERVGGFGGKADRLNEYEVFTGDAGFAAGDLSRYRSGGRGGVTEAAAELVASPRVAVAVVPQGRRDLAWGGGAA